MKKIYLIFLLLSLFLISSVYADNSTVSVDIIHATDRYEQNQSYPVLFQTDRCKRLVYPRSGEGRFHDSNCVLSFQESEKLRIDNISFPEPGKDKI